MNLQKLKEAIESHASHESLSDDEVRTWLTEEVQQLQRVHLADIYRVALQRGVDEELEELAINVNVPVNEQKIAKHLLRMLSQTVIHDIDVGHVETQSNFGVMVASTHVPSFDAQFAADIAALGVHSEKRHVSLGVGLPLVREISAARAL